MIKGQFSIACDGAFKRRFQQSSPMACDRVSRRSQKVLLPLNVAACSRAYEHTKSALPRHVAACPRNDERCAATAYDCVFQKTSPLAWRVVAFHRNVRRPAPVVCARVTDRRCASLLWCVTVAFMKDQVRSDVLAFCSDMIANKSVGPHNTILTEMITES